MTSQALNPLIDPATSDDRLQRIQRANIRCASLLIPQSVYSMFESRPAIRSCYAALISLMEEGIDDPRLLELSLVGEVSESAIVKATARLLAAGLITKTRLRHGTGRPIVYQLVTPDESDK